MKKLILNSLITAIVLGASTSAYASVHSYYLNNGSTLTINTATGQGSVIGRNIDATFTGDFSSFTGGENPSRISIPIDNLNGTRVIRGRTLNVTPENTADHPYSLNFDNNGNINLWARWGGGNRYGDYLSSTTGYTFTPTSSSTSSGGLSSTGGVSSTSSSSTGGGTPTGSTGGTDVPAPGALLLFGLGAAGLAFGNRRRKIKIEN